MLFLACPTDTDDETNPSSEVVISSIEILENPTKTVYFVSDTFVPSGLAIQANYSNDTTEIKSYNGFSDEFTITGTDFSTAGTKTVTVTYKGKSATFNVTVTEKSLSLIAVRTNPTKTTYALGEDFEPVGLVIKATYSNGSTENISYSASSADFSFSNTDFSTTGSADVTITYKEKTTTLTVTVGGKKLVSISIKTNPTKITYEQEQSFDPSGLVITETYTDDSTEDIAYVSSNSDFAFSGTDFTEVGEQTVTVTYKEKTATLKVTITEATTKTFNFSDLLVENDDNKLVVDTTKITGFVGKDVTIKLPYGADTSVNISQLLVLNDILTAEGNSAKSVVIDRSNYANVTFAGNSNNALEISKLNKFKNLALDLSVAPEYLPNLAINLWDDVGDSDNKTNLYGTELDKIIEKYYSDNDTKSKLSFDMLTTSTFEFDAKEYLNGGSMYDENNNFNDTAYELDINAALLMRSELKNVNIVGENKTDKTNAPNLYNVRIESDIDGLVLTGHGYGVIDFAGNAPAQTPIATEGKVIIRKIADTTTSLQLHALHTLDVSELDATSLNKINATNIGITEIYYGDATATFGETSTSFGAKYQNGTVRKQTTGYTPINANNKAWEITGNDENHAIPTGPVAKAQSNVKQSILQKLIDDNQKVYG